MILSKEALTGGVKPVPVECKAMGGTVLLKPLTIAEYMQFEELKEKIEDEKMLASLLLCFSMVDEEGNRILSDDDVSAFYNNVPALDLTALFDVATEINGLSEQSDIKKN